MMIKNKNNTKKIIFICLGLLLLAGGSYAIYALNYKPYEKNKSGEYVAEDSISKDSENKDDETNNKESGNQNQTIDRGPKSQSKSTSDTGLEKPTGTFVSSHNVQPNSTIESVCITSPGAECRIELTMGNTVKKLNTKPTNDQGYTSWIWKPNKLGINSGSWQVKAVAIKDGQTKESTDPKNLEVN